MPDNISGYQVGGAALPGAEKLLNALAMNLSGNPTGTVNQLNTLAHIGYLRAHADQARALTDLAYTRERALQNQERPMSDTELAPVAALGAGTTDPIATSFLLAQRGTPLPSQNPAANVPVPDDVGTRLGQTAYALQASRVLPGKTNFQEMTAGQGNLQKQDIVNQALAAGEKGDRNALVTKLEILSQKPEMFSQGESGTLNTASGTVTPTPLIEAKTGAEQALGTERLAHAKYFENPDMHGGGGNSRVAVYNHFVNDLGMDEDEALQKTRSLFGAKSEISDEEIGQKRYNEVLKATGSTAKAKQAEQELVQSLKTARANKQGAASPPPQSTVDREAAARGQLNRSQAPAPAPSTMTTPPAQTPASQKVVDQLKAINTDRAKLKATVEMLYQQGFTRSQVRDFLERAGVRP